MKLKNIFIFVILISFIQPANAHIYYNFTFNESVNDTISDIITDCPSNGSINVYVNSTFYTNLNMDDGIFELLFSILFGLQDFELYCSNITADFTATETSGCCPFCVQFIDLSTNATYYNWDFGDGETSTDQNPTHTYEEEGVYTVVLNASNIDGYDLEIKNDYIIVESAFNDPSNIATSTVPIIMVTTLVILFGLVIESLRGKVEVSKIVPVVIGVLVLMILIYVIYGIGEMLEGAFNYI